MKRWINCSTQNVKLKVQFYPYERYRGGSGIKSATVSGPDLLSALKKMVDRMNLYITSEEIDDEEMSAEEVIERIESENGDGCDLIILLKNLVTGETYISEGYEEDDWD